jgi:hypothetical protein
MKSDGSAVPTKEEFLRVQYRKRAAEALKIELGNRQAQGELIERDRVRTHILGFIDASHRRLLYSSTTIVSRLYSLAASGTGAGEAERFVSDTLSAILTVARDQVTRNLRCKRQRQPEESNDANRSA